MRNEAYFTFLETTSGEEFERVDVMAKVDLDPLADVKGEGGDDEDKWTRSSVEVRVVPRRTFDSRENWPHEGNSP